MALCFRKAGSKMTGQAALPHRNIQRDFQNKTGEYQARMNNVLTNIRLVKTCIAEEKEEERGKLLTKELFNIGIKGGKITALVQPLTTMLIFLLLILIFGYGSVRVSNGSLSAGSLVAIIYYLFQIATPCMGLTAFVGQLNRSCGAMERISKILNEEIVEKKIKKEIIISDQKCNCGLVLDNISFRYSDRKNTLCSISFFIEKGETLAIVGESGSGKSTIFSLIERFYEQDKGNIYYEGIDVRNIPMNDWRGKIAYVQQESPIMSGTILDNLTYGLDSYNEKNVLSALEKAELNRFISSLPKGYNTDVGEQGVKLSGGQKQRIAIARAMIRNPEILLLDEATANLDSCTEKSVQRALERLMLGRITIVAAHRFSTIKCADKIVVLQKGRICGSGTHEELGNGKLQLNPMSYQVIYEGKEIDLTPREFEVLYLLALKPNWVMPKTNIYHSVWGIHYHDDQIPYRTVEYVIWKIRKKMGHDIIETLVNVGYRLKKL